ncbi:hypothetical protein [Niameybacter sp.]
MTQAPINSITHSSSALYTLKKDIKQISTITYDIADFALQSVDISELLAARSQELKALLSQFTFNA